MNKSGVLKIRVHKRVPLRGQIFKNRSFQFANEFEMVSLNFGSLEVFKCVGTCFCSSEPEPLLVRVSVPTVEAYE